MDAPRKTKDRARQLRRELSLPEVLLWKAIKGRKLFRKQHPIGPYVLDFYCEACRLAVEVDGGSHSLGDRPLRDVQRDVWLPGQGVDDATGTILARAEARGGW